MKKKNRRRSRLLGAWLCAMMLLFVGSVVIWHGAVQSAEKPMMDSASAQEWNLILVNQNHPLPAGYTLSLTTLSNGRSVDSRIYPELQAMFDAMRNEGIYPVVGEGYRTASEQEQMMKDKILQFRAEGYSSKAAARMAAQLVAAVGCSEHQLGLAVDINADPERSTNDAVYTWLADHAATYGFILRYPSDKTELTGIDYEPWHYRYVGTEAANAICSKGVCLEEYLGETG